MSLRDEYNFQYLWIWFYKESRLEDIVGGAKKRTRMTNKEETNLGIV